MLTRGDKRRTPHQRHPGPRAGIRLSLSEIRRKPGAIGLVRADHSAPLRHDLSDEYVDAREPLRVGCVGLFPRLRVLVSSGEGGDRDGARDLLACQTPLHFEF